MSVRQTSAETHVGVTVSDTGRGLETKRRVVDTFYRGDAARSSEGNGPGLAPTSKVVEPAASSFMVEREEGKGFAFRVRLPVSREKTVL
ncbi:MAG: ATP-binding protein [Christensenellaceae bacterium]